MDMYSNSITIQYMYRYWTHIAADLKPRYYLSGTYFNIFYVSHNKYKIFTQHSCCLAGRAYPLGDIPEEMEADVKKNVFQCITRMKIKAGQSARFPFLLSFLEFFFLLWCIASYSEIIHHGNFSNVTLTPLADDSTYPYLRTLLQFDTREFLNVLALVSVEELFS